MRRGPWRIGTGLLVVTAWLSLSPTTGAQGPISRAPGRLEPVRVEGECAEARELEVTGPQGCLQESLATPTWLGPVPAPGPNSEGVRCEERARDVLDRLHSPEYLSRLKSERARLQREVFGDVLRATRGAEEPTVPASHGLPPTERIYLFISESIPLETLRNYAQDIAEIGDPGIVLVLRGFVGGMQHVLPTRQFVLDVLRKDLACDPDTRSDCQLHPVNLVIDPLLFRRYAVQDVPAVVYAPGVEAARVVGSKELRDSAAAGRFWQISGDAGLGHLLRRIQLAAGGDALRSILHNGP